MCVTYLILLQVDVDHNNNLHQHQQGECGSVLHITQPAAVTTYSMYAVGILNTTAMKCMYIYIPPMYIPATMRISEV